MKKELKLDYIQVRSTITEKQTIILQAKEEGFDHVSSYIMWILRKRRMQIGGFND